MNYQKSNHPFLKSEQKAELFIYKKETPGSLNLMLDFRDFSNNHSKD